MDWFSIIALVLIGAVAVVIAWLASRRDSSRASDPRDPDRYDALQKKQDDLRKGTSWENSGL